MISVPLIVLNDLCFTDFVKSTHSFTLFFINLTCGLFSADKTQQSEMSTIIEEPSIAQDTTLTRSRRSEKSLSKTPREAVQPETSHVSDTSTAQQDLLAQATEGIVDIPTVAAVDASLQQDQNLVNYDPNMEDGPPSIAPFSVGPASVGPPSVGPPSVAPPVRLYMLLFMLLNVYILRYVILVNSCCILCHCYPWMDYVLSGSLSGLASKF